MEQTLQGTQELDVRTMIPMDRHTTLLRMFKELPVKHSFIFINDHDPIPLFYEMRSIHGDVVGWEYLYRGGRDWKVKVTREEASIGREFHGISTLIDLRKVNPAQWRHVIFHRYGLMPEGGVMELVAAAPPEEVRATFQERFAGKHTWTQQRQTADEVVVHIKKTAAHEESVIRVVNTFDVRPHPPAKRHDLVYEAFAALQPGEAFVFTNDHDPLPLYYQLEAENPVPFTWQYLASGPEVWTVRVAMTNGEGE